MKKNANATSPRNKHATTQEVGTPLDFLRVVQATFGPIAWDLAATEQNRVVGGYFSPEQNSLVQDWHKIPGWLWLNPPFKNIAKWVEKAHQESTLGAKVMVLVPASVGSRWFAEWVYCRAEVRFLVGRLTFSGHHQPYPKDLMLLIYRPGPCLRYPHPWDWRQTGVDLGLGGELRTMALMETVPA